MSVLYSAKIGTVSTKPNIFILTCVNFFVYTGVIKHAWFCCGVPVSLYTGCLFTELRGNYCLAEIVSPGLVSHRAALHDSTSLAARKSERRRGRGCRERALP